LKRFCQSIDKGNDFIALLDGKAAAGREAILHVDDDQGRVGPGRNLCLSERARHEQSHAEAAGAGKKATTRGSVHRANPSGKLMLSPA
jgi:hypothetical protein